MPDAIRDLSDPDPRVRRDAISALCSRPRVKALPGLFLALSDADGSVRTHAPFAIGYLGAEAVDAVPALCKALRDRLSGVRGNAALALRNIGKPAAAALPALVAALSDRNEGVRWNSVIAITAIGLSPDHAPALLPLLRDKSKEVRAYAQRCFALIGLPAAAALPALRENLQHRDATVRITAARALWAVTGEIEEAFALFEEEYATAEQGGRREIAETVAQMEKNDAVAGFLLYALDDEDARVSVYAAEGITLHQGRPKDGIPVLIACLGHADWFTRRDAAEALSRLGKLATPALPALRQACADEDERVRVAATTALEALAAATSVRKKRS